MSVQNDSNCATSFVEEYFSCPVDCEPLTNAIKLDVCGHVFNKASVDGIVARSAHPVCPLCRREFKEIKIDQETRNLVRDALAPQNLSDRRVQMADESPARYPNANQRMEIPAHNQERKINANNITKEVTRNEVSQKAYYKAPPYRNYNQEPVARRVDFKSNPGAEVAEKKARAWEIAKIVGIVFGIVLASAAIILFTVLPVLGILPIWCMAVGWAPLLVAIFPAFYSATVPASVRYNR